MLVSIGLKDLNAEIFRNRKFYSRGKDLLTIICKIIKTQNIKSVLQSVRMRDGT